MKGISQLIAMVLSAAFLAGCDLVNLMQFRRQLRSAPPIYYKDAAGRSASLSFPEPMLAWETLADVGIPLERQDEETAVARYVLRISGRADEPFPVVFKFQNSRLKTVEMPAVVPELLGAKNIIAFFRLAAGTTLSANAFDDITSAEAEAVMDRHYGAPMPLGLGFVVYLRADRADCRDISITLERSDVVAPFKKITLRIKRPADM